MKQAPRPGRRLCKTRRAEVRPRVGEPCRRVETRQAPTPFGAKRPIDAAATSSRERDLTARTGALWWHRIPLTATCTARQSLQTMLPSLQIAPSAGADSAAPEPTQHGTQG